MKFSKVFTGLVVCGALIFPGALNSSAQEIDSSISYENENPIVSVESSSYLAELETELSTLNESSRAVDSINLGRFWEGYQGPSFKYSISVQQPAPYAPAIYSGYVFYDYSQSDLSRNLYWYQGILSLQK